MEFYKIGAGVVSVSLVPTETAKEVKAEEDRESTDSLSIPQIVKKIQVLESSSGLNNYSKCQAQGKWNRSGFGIPGNGTYRCFDTQEEEDKTIGEWFEKELKDKTLGQACCKYNTGKATDTCQYHTKFLSLNK